MSNNSNDSSSGGGRRLSTRGLLEYLLDNGRVSVPDAAGDLGVSPGTVDYHLKKLVDRGVVVHYEGDGFRGYGSKYGVDRSLVDSTPILVLAVLDVLLTFYGLFTYSPPLLFASSSLGLVFLWYTYFRSVSDRVDELVKHAVTDFEKR